MPGESASVLRARRFVCVHLVEHRLFYLIDDVRLVVSELAGNAVRHANSPFTVSLGRADRAVSVSVQDGSPGTPALLVPELLDTAGRGVFIVDLVSDDWGVTHAPGGGKSVWASFSTR